MTQINPPQLDLLKGFLEHSDATIAGWLEQMRGLGAKARLVSKRPPAMETRMTQERRQTYAERCAGIDFVSADAEIVLAPMPRLPDRRTSGRADLADLDRLLGARCGPMTLPPRIGAPDEGLPVLGEAPGNYVLRK
jgi:hypothetical protein